MISQPQFPSYTSVKHWAWKSVILTIHLDFLYPLAAIALGATVIEKHFTLDKNLPGWDHKVSANPEEMRIIASESKRIVDALGNGIKVVSDDEIAKQKKFRRSITTANSLKAGHGNHL